MDLSRLDKGERIACLSAIVLFILMFFHWFEFEAVFNESGSHLLPSLQPFPPEKSTWDALGYLPFLFVIAIGVALVVAALRLTPGAELSVRADATVALCGIVSALLILFRIVDRPTFDGGEAHVFEGMVQFPVFLALAAATGIAFGGCLAAWEEAKRRSLAFQR